MKLKDQKIREERCAALKYWAEFFGFESKMDLAKAMKPRPPNDSVGKFYRQICRYFRGEGVPTIRFCIFAERAIFGKVDGRIIRRIDKNEMVEFDRRRSMHKLKSSFYPQLRSCPWNRPDRSRGGKQPLAVKRGEALKNAMGDRFDQESLAEALDKLGLHLSPVTIKSYMDGWAVVSEHHMVFMSSVLGVPPSFLMGHEYQSGISAQSNGETTRKEKKAKELPGVVKIDGGYMFRAKKR